MSKKLLYYIAFFVVLVLVFWALLYKYTDHFNQSRLIKKAVVQPFEFTTQNGTIFNNDSTLGKVYVVEYFFTTCTSICPKMNTNMKTIYEAFKDEPNFLILSHTCDPKRDTALQLKKFAETMQVNTNKWIFLTGRKDSLYNIARLSYGIDDPQNIVSNIDDDFLHSQFFALVDKQGNVRGQVYDGLIEAEINKLKKDIKELLKEKIVNKNFSNGMFN